MQRPLILYSIEGRIYRLDEDIQGYGHQVNARILDEIKKLLFVYVILAHTLLPNMIKK